MTDSTGNQATKQDTILVANAAPEVSVDAATGKAGEPVWIHLWAWDPGEADNGSLHYHLQVGPAEFKEDRVVGVLDVKVPGLPSGVHKAS